MSRKGSFKNRLTVVLLFIFSLGASVGASIGLKDIYVTAFRIHQAPRVVQAQINQYLGENRCHSRGISYSTHQYRVSGDGQQWFVHLPHQVPEGSFITITYAATDPNTFVVGRYIDFYSLLKKDILGLVFLSGVLAATALFGYGVYFEFNTRS